MNKNQGKDEPWELISAIRGNGYYMYKVKGIEGVDGDATLYKQMYEDPATFYNRYDPNNGGSFDYYEGGESTVPEDENGGG